MGVLTFLSNMFSNLNLTDMETSYKSVSARDHPVDQDRGRQVWLRAGDHGQGRAHEVRICEVGISYYERTYAEGKKINWRDGIRAFYCIVKYNAFANGRGGDEQAGRSRRLFP